MAFSLILEICDVTYAMMIEMLTGNSVYKMKFL